MIPSYDFQNKSSTAHVRPKGIQNRPSHKKFYFWEQPSPGGVARGIPGVGGGSGKFAGKTSRGPRGGHGTGGGRRIDLAFPEPAWRARQSLLSSLGGSPSAPRLPEVNQGRYWIVPLAPDAHRGQE